MNKQSVSYPIIVFAIVIFWLLVIAGMFFGSSISLFNDSRVINILSWGGVFDARTISDFTRQTGIKVNISYYTTNEELLVMLKSTKGIGYDLVVPSDYAVKKLCAEKLLKKIDKSKLVFINNLNPLFMGYDYDISNDYSLPYMIEFFGLGYDRDYFKGDLPNPSWQWIFSDPGKFKIIMTNDPVEAVCLGSFYLFGSNGNQLNEHERKAVKQLLIDQRPWVEAYTDFRPDYFLITGNCPLVVTSFSSILRGLEVNNSIDFALPQEGAFLSIENCALVNKTKNDDLVYDFLNFAYSRDIMKYHYDELSSLPATIDVLSELDVHSAVKGLLDLPKSEFVKKITFFLPLLPEEKLQDLWVSVKSR